MARLELVAANSNIPEFSHRELCREMDRALMRKIALVCACGIAGIIGLIILAFPEF